MGLRDTLGDFLHWWAGTLGQTMPKFMAGKKKPIDVQLTIQRNGFLLEPIAGNRLQFEPALINDATELNEAIGILKRGHKAKSGKIGLLLKIADERFIVRQVSPINLPNSAKINMANIDMQGATPFKPDEVFMFINDASGLKAASSYAVVKKPFLQPVLDQLSKAKCQIVGVEFGSKNNFNPSAQSLRSIFSASHLASLPQMLVKLGLVALIIGTLLTLGRVHLRHSEANNALDIAIETANNEASAVRRLIAERNETLAQLTAIRSEKDDITPVVIIMEELSRVIPDGTWITDLEINSGVVQISGFSANAAKLIPALEASPYFFSPTFRSPVLKVSVDIGERFSVTMRIEKQANADG